jgi:hypothetical protein
LDEAIIGSLDHLVGDVSHFSLVPHERVRPARSL